MNAPLTKSQIALLNSNNLSYQRTATALPQAPSLLASLGQRVTGAFAAMLSFPRRRAVVEELSRLTDRELTDIGLTRADLTLVFDPKFRSTYRG